MVTFANMIGSTDFGDLANAVRRDLIDVKVEGANLRLVTPVLFPSGSHVTIRVHGGPEKFVITDDGCASIEAEMMGADPIFLRAAKDIAQQRGVRFNEFEFFEAEAPAGRVSGYIAIIADAAKAALELTSLRVVEKIERDARQNVEDRIRDIFGHDRVEIPARLKGASSHDWDFDAIAHVDGKDIVFAVTSPAPISVASNFMKLDDIRRLVVPPRGVAMLTRMSDFKSDQLVILNRAARILGADEPDEKVRALAA